MSACSVSQSEVCPTDSSKRFSFPSGNRGPTETKRGVTIAGIPEKVSAKLMPEVQSVRVRGLTRAGSPRMALWCAAVWCCLATWGAAPATDNFAKEDLAFFQEKIRPLLSGHCFECHSHSAKKLKGGLFLDNRSGVLQGGDSGPAIVPGQPEQSRLVEAVRYQNPDLRMPPKTKLEDFEIALLEDWVKRGVPWPEESLVANAPAAAKKAAPAKAAEAKPAAKAPAKKAAAKK